MNRGLPLKVFVVNKRYRLAIYMCVYQLVDFIFIHPGGQVNFGHENKCGFP